MNHFSYTVTADATKKHFAIKLFTAAALQLRTSCLLLIYVILFTASCWSFILSCTNPPFLTSFIIATIGLCEET